MPGEVCRQTSYSMITNLGSPSPIFGTVSNSRFAQCARCIGRLGFRRMAYQLPVECFLELPEKIRALENSAEQD